MAMQAASLEVLEEADVPSAQARAIVQAIEIQMTAAKETLATKHDLLLLRTELREEMGELRSELRGEMAELRHEMQQLGSNLYRHMYTAMLGQMAVLLGVAYFFVSHVVR